MWWFAESAQLALAYRAMSVAAVILAGGRSTRMGRPKALLDYRGAPFVVRIVEALVALEVRPRVVVVGPGAQTARAALVGQDCLVIENAAVDGGPIASLRCAIAVLRPHAPTGLLVWPVDLPHVRLATVARLLDAFRRSEPALAVPRFGGRRGHPVIWSARLFEALETSDAAAREGARAVAAAHRGESLELGVDDPAVVDSLNTPEDYERLVRAWTGDA